MKLSLKWLREYIDINMSPVEIGEILTDIGLEVEGMEEVESIKGGLKGLVIGEVKTCVQHPNADRLSLTTVDIGNAETVQIVCGAPNVAAGQKVVVATVGTTLYSPEGEAWKIKKGKIRGEVSEGMICAEDEIGIGTSHDGIIVLPAEVKVGTLVKDHYNVESDYIYDIGLTPNRSDATAHLGAVRDLAAALKVNHNHDGIVKTPSVDDFKIDNTDSEINVKVIDIEGCPRYSGLVITGIKVGPSPAWLRQRIESIGVRAINNIVDITNFILHELGQPLHAFDLDKIGQQSIVVKTLPEGTVFKSLDEKDRKLRSEDVMICDGDGKAMCIGGVFGGIDSGVTDTTSAIFLESAHFNPKRIRRTSTKHLLFTDAAKVFEKGSDPNGTIYALKRAAMLIKELAGGVISSDIVDLYPSVIEKQQISLTFKNIRRHIGVDIAVAEIKNILVALHIDILKETDEGMTVAVPTDKADVTREVDVIEEIIRIYGFNKIPIPDRISSSLVFQDGVDQKALRNAATEYLLGNGLSEMMGLSLTQSKNAKEVLGFEEDHLVFINNTSNIHLDIMRPSMLLGTLDTVAHNHNRQSENLSLFEFGRTYAKIEDGFKESNHLTITLSGSRQSSWKRESKNDFFVLKGLVNNLLSRMGISSYKTEEADTALFDYGISYLSGRDTLVSFGKVNGPLATKMDVKKDVFFADINWDLLTQRRSKKSALYTPLNKYPVMKRDLAVVIDNGVQFDQLETIARKTGKKLLKSVSLFDVYKNKAQLGADKKSYALSLTFEDKEKTLKDKQVEKIMSELVKKYESELGATIRN